MDKRASVCLILCVLGLAGCSVIFPNTAEAIRPEGATIEEAGFGLLADIQLWVETVGGWIAYLFGVAL